MGDVTYHRNIMIEYLNDDNAQRGQMSHYHHKPRFRDYREGASLGDISGLSASDRDALHMKSPLIVGAQFGIGFEIEKNRISRGAVRPYPLFCGFERDSSCGYEAVTNILPLVGKSIWRNKVFNMFHEAERVIDDQWSPSDYSCGGHMTISVDGMSGEELMEIMRPLSGIVLALYRRRLNHHYCNSNMTMLPRGHDDVYNGYQRSNVVNVKTGAIEYRLPSRITSVASLKRRYELMYVLVDCAVKGKTASYALRKVQPIVLAMYEGNKDKTAKVMSLAKAMTKFIKSGKINAEVMPFVDRTMQSDMLHTRCATALRVERLRAFEAREGYRGRVSLDQW